MPHLRLGRTSVPVALIVASVVVWVSPTACKPFSSSQPDDGGGVGVGTGDGATIDDAGAASITITCGASGCPAPCKSLHAARSELPTGTYEIDLDGAGPLGVRSVYCDMEIEGGGWTLVARSVANHVLDVGFGWHSGNGMPTDDSQPYSLEIGSLGVVDISELLFGAYATGKVWADPVYRHALPPNFVNTYQTTGYNAGAATTVRGTCAPPNGPSFLVWIGRTNVKNHWFFRDNNASPGFGLFSDGWESNYSNILVSQHCTAGADLGDKQAMIFVR